MISDIEWRTERRRLGDLVEWAKNPRRLTSAQAEQIAESIRNGGYADPIIVTPDNRIIGGHMRRRVMLQKLGYTPDEEVDVRVPSRDLTPEEFEELAIRLNKNTAEWDWDRLANEFDTTRLLEWGFSEKDLLDTDSEEDGTEPLPQAIQLEPEREYVVVMAADAEEWERLKVALNLQPVRRGGYRHGSPFDATGTQRVIHARDLLSKIGG